MVAGTSAGGGSPRVAVLIPSWNGRAHLETCLAALAEQHDPGMAWDVWVLDNGSSDGTAEWLEREWLPRAQPRVHLVRSDRNVGFAAGIQGRNMAPTGQSIGVFGTTLSTNGTGVFGASGLLGE